MHFRIHDHFRCQSPLSAAQAWERIRQQTNPGTAFAHPEPGLYGSYDYRSGCFRLTHSESKPLSRGIPTSTRLVIGLHPQETGCGVEVTIAPSGAALAYCGIWLGFALLMLVTVITQYRTGQDSFMLYAIAHLSVMLALFFVMMIPRLLRECAGARRDVLELVGGRDLEQLPYRGIPKPVPERSSLSQVQNEPEIPLPWYDFQQLCPVPPELLRERITDALRDPASGFAGERTAEGYLLRLTEGRLGLRPTLEIELYPHPEGCLVAGRLRHHLGMQVILFLLGSPMLVVSLLGMCISIRSMSIGGAVLSLILLTPSVIVWGAGAAVLMKEGAHLRENFRNLLTSFRFV